MGHHHHHKHEHPSGGRLIGTIALNIIITVAEFAAGIYTGYLALMADAVHNLSDVAALFLAWLGFKGSQMPATKRSTYGYMRIEVMTAFISAVALVVIAIYILWEAYQRYLFPQEITHPGIFITVAVIGLLGNLASVWLLASEKGKSLNMKTAFLHMAYDAVSSVAVIIGGILILVTGNIMIDVFLSVAIALMIFWSSYLVIKEATLVFLEAVPADIDYDQVLAAIESVNNVCSVHDLHIWSLSSNDVALSCHVFLDDADFAASQQVIAEITRRLIEQFTIGHATIQIEHETCPHPNQICTNHESNRG